MVELATLPVRRKKLKKHEHRLESSGNPEHLPRDPLPRHEVFEDQDKENVHAQVNDVLLIALRVPF